MLHADGGGLHLLVKESGARSWVYRYMLKGRSRDAGIGAAGPDGISLAKARDLAAALRLKVKAGIDPLDERQRESSEALAAAQAASIAGITFKAVAEAYIGANEASWRNDKHRQQWRNTLATYVYPVMGELPVADIATAHVLQILEPIWQDKPETASRIRGRIETVLDRVIGKGKQPEDIFKAFMPTDPDQANKVRSVMRSLAPSERQVVSEAVANRLGRAKPGASDSTLSAGPAADGRAARESGACRPLCASTRHPAPGLEALKHHAGSRRRTVRDRFWPRQVGGPG